MLNDFISLFFPNYCVTCLNALVRGEEIICLQCDHNIPKTNSHNMQDNFVARKFFEKFEKDHCEIKPGLMNIVLLQMNRFLPSLAEKIAKKR